MHVHAKRDELSSVCDQHIFPEHHCWKSDFQIDELAEERYDHDCRAESCTRLFQEDRVVQQFEEPCRLQEGDQTTVVE